MILRNHKNKTAKIRLKEGLDGGGGGVQMSLSLKISAICQLSVKWLLMINFETYLYFGLKGTYNVN